MGRKYKRCKKCLMDTTDSNIVFDSRGICDHCNYFENKILPIWNFGLDRGKDLDALIKKIKKAGEGREFDCLFGMSGGIDSSYLLHLVKKKFKLRPLVFHVDAGWNSELAVNNIEKLVDSLGVDLFTKVIDWEEIKELQLSFFNSGVPHIDTPQDHIFFASMYQFAVKYNIKYILSGANFSTECIRNPKEWMYFQSDLRQIKDIHKKYGKRKLKNIPFANILWYKVWLRYFKNIKIVSPLNYVEYNKNSARDFLVKNYGWKPYKQKHFESIFTKFYEGYWLYERFGFDVRKVQLSSLILTNQMKREEAIEILESKPYDEKSLERDKEYIANKLEISLEKLDYFFNLPKRSFHDFSNQNFIYEIGTIISKKLGINNGIKR